VWLVSREDPLTFARSLDDDRAQRFRILLEKADGWTRRDHLVAGPHIGPHASEKAGESFAKAMPEITPLPKTA
jgi:hypothetical protein